VTLRVDPRREGRPRVLDTTAALRAQRRVSLWRCARWRCHATDRVVACGATRGIPLAGPPLLARTYPAIAGRAALL